MATTDGSLREHTWSKSNIPCTALFCIPQMIDFVVFVKRGLTSSVEIET